MNETRYPLSWPANWKRTPASERKTAAFMYRGDTNQYGTRPKNRLSVWDGVNRVQDELRRLVVASEGDIIVSTNVPTRLDGIPRSDRAEPADPGAAVYWKFKGKRQCMAIDRYDRVADNLAAIAATLEALRAIKRHGGGSILDRAFAGFAQLPAGSRKPWREVFGITDHDHLNRDAIQTRYVALARQRHSDVPGGSHDAMAELNAARDEALAEISA